MLDIGSSTSFAKYSSTRQFRGIVAPIYVAPVSLNASITDFQLEMFIHPLEFKPSDNIQYLGGFIFEFFRCCSVEWYFLWWAHSRIKKKHPISNQLPKTPKLVDIEFHSETDSDEKSDIPFKDYVNLPLIAWSYG